MTTDSNTRTKAPDAYDELLSSSGAVKVSVVLPARNEANTLPGLLQSIKDAVADSEIVVVDDGSTDDTSAVCVQAKVRCVSHRYAKGNGAAIKTGARVASGDVLVFLDADGQHDPADIPKLLARMAKGFDMVVGARAWGSQASVGRGIANAFYNRFASWVVGHTIADLTSGFRAVRADRFREFLYLLPNGFSYPTTSTMVFFRSGYSVEYMPIQAKKRIGKSHIRPIRDGVRFLLIVIRICTLYSPLRIFIPCSFMFFSAGVAYYLYTYITEQRFTNMSALLFSTSVLIFLIGLVSEQITALTYRDSGRK